jgi:hypothetical protein
MNDYPLIVENESIIEAHSAVQIEVRPAAPRRGPECPTCMGPHDEEIHAATLSVRQWFRGEVTKSFEPVQLM